MCKDTIRGHKMTDIESNLALINEMDVELIEKIINDVEPYNDDSPPILLELYKIDNKFIWKSWHSGSGRWRGDNK